MRRSRESGQGTVFQVSGGVDAVLVAAAATGGGVTLLPGGDFAVYPGG